MRASSKEYYLKKTINRILPICIMIAVMIKFFITSGAIANEENYGS